MPGQSSCQKQIVLPPLCMPPQSFPQPCCPQPCFYPPPCFPCFPPNPCCPQPCCPPPCPPCCPPPCQPCCQTPCVPCCPKVPSSPCCPPQCSPSTKSRCNCCGGRSTVICVPRGSRPPCLPTSCSPCPCPCPCRPSCCPSPCCCGGDSGTEKPPSFNNCNFYCSELPKGFSGGQCCCPEEEEDPCCCPPDCCPSEQTQCCEDGGRGGYRDDGNRAAGDDQLAPIPRGHPRKYGSRSHVRNQWNYNPTVKGRPSPPRRPSRSRGRSSGKFNRRDCPNENDIYVDDSQCSNDDFQNSPQPPRPPRQSNDPQFCYQEEEEDEEEDCPPQPSFFCYQTTATSNSVKSSIPSVLTHCRGPSVALQGRQKVSTGIGKKSGQPPKHNNWTGVNGVKSPQIGLKTKVSVETRTETVSVETETIDKVVTAPVQPNPRTDVSTATNTTIPLTAPLRLKNPNKGPLTLSRVEMKNQPNREMTNVRNYRAPPSQNPTNNGGKNRKFKNPGIKLTDFSFPQKNTLFKPGDRRNRNVNQISNDDPQNPDFSKKNEENDLDKMLWTLIPTPLSDNQTPLSTLNIFGPRGQMMGPQNASSDFISVPPTSTMTQPPSFYVPLDRFGQLLKIESGPVVQTGNDLLCGQLMKRRRVRSCDPKRRRRRGHERVATAVPCCDVDPCLDEEDCLEVDLTVLTYPCICVPQNNNNCEEVRSTSRSKGRDEQRVVCETLASILKKTPLHCRGLDGVKFARQDFCVMTCFVERRSRSRSPKPCGQNECGCPSPIPPSCIPPSCSPPCLNSCQWKNFKFTSTPSCHQTGCSPCSNVAPHKSFLPPIGPSVQKCKKERNPCCSSSCCPCPILPCSSPCPLTCNPMTCGSPYNLTPCYLTPVNCPRPCRRKRKGQCPINRLGTAGSPSPGPDSQSQLQQTAVKPDPFEVTRGQTPPPRPPPPAPLRPPPPSSRQDQTLKSPMKSKSPSPTGVDPKNYSGRSGSQEQSESENKNVQDILFNPQVKCESTYTCDPQCCILPPCYLPYPPVTEPPSPKIKVPAPTFQPPPPPPIEVDPPPSEKPKVKKKPEPELPPEDEEDEPTKVPPPSPAKKHPYPYGMKYPPKVPPLILPPISPRRPSTPKDGTPDPPEPLDTHTPPRKSWVTRQPSKKYFQFVPKLDRDCCSDPRKSLKARRRCKCPDVNNNKPIRKPCCPPEDDCCPDPCSNCNNGQCQCPPNLKSQLNSPGCCRNPC